MKYKKIIMSLLLVAVLAFGSASMALADEYEGEAASDLGFWVDADGLFYFDYYFFSQFFDMFTCDDSYSLQVKSAFLDNVYEYDHMLYLYEDMRYITLAFSRFGFDYHYDKRPGNTWYHGYFTDLNSASCYVLIFDVVGMTYSCQFTNTFTSVCSWAGYEADEQIWKDIVYSSHPILHATTGDIFFQQAPAEVGPQTPAGKLTQIMAEAPLADLTIPILALVPICLVFLAGYLALRKALEFLQTILRQA